MKIELRRVDKSNWFAVCRLEVRKSEQEYIAPNAFSLAQAAYEADTFPLAIYADGVLVGFLMWNYDSGLGVWGLARLMVAPEYRSRGIARGAVSMLLSQIRAQKGKIPFYTCVPADNDAALALMQSLGFSAVQNMEDGELLMRIQL